MGVVHDRLNCSTSASLMPRGRYRLCLVCGAVSVGRGCIMQGQLSALLPEVWRYRNDASRRLIVALLSLCANSVSA